MNTHADKTQRNKSQSVANEISQKQSGCGESTFQFADNRTEAVEQRKLQVMANNSSQAQQLGVFQKMENDSLLEKETTYEIIKPILNETKQLKDKTTVQLMSSVNARERIIQNRNNRRRLLAVLLVIAANIIAGNFILEDVDDLLEDGEDREFLVDQISKQQQKAERMAQGQQIRANSKAQFGRQNNNRGGGKIHKGR